MSASPPPPVAPGPPNGASAAHTTSTGLDPKVAGLLTYLAGWISGLILYLVEKENREIRFHAAQSILVSIAFIAAYIVLSIISLVPVIGWIIGLIATLVVGLGGLITWIYLMIQGYNLNHVRLPVIGAMAEQWATR